MADRLCFIHTVATLVPRFAELASQHLPGVDVFHTLDESLLQDLLRHGPGTSITSRVVGHAELAADAGATAIVFTCSSTSPAVDVARQVVDVPIIKIDDPMAHTAVLNGKIIGVLCTTSSTVEPSRQLLATHAAVAGREVEIVPHLVADAFDALRSGDRATHDRLVSDSAATLSGRCDLLVLAQASLAHLRDDLEAALGRPVLSSPDPLMAELVRRFGKGDGK